MISLLLANTIFQLFLMMFFGYLLVKTKIVNPFESTVLSKLSLYLVMPCVIISSFQVEFKPEVQQGLLLTTGAAVVIHFLLIVFGTLLGKMAKFDEIEQASVVYSNAGNLIIPIVMAILGSEWVIYSMTFVSVQMILLWTHCRMLFTKGVTFSLRYILLNINMMAILIGVVMLLAGIKLPDTINNTFAAVGSMLGPLCMLITGMIVAGMNLKSVFSNKKVYQIVALRMVICPLLILMLFKLTAAETWTPYGKELLLITFLATAAPTASTITQFAQLSGKNAQYAGAINIISTFVCIITMPIFVYFYQK